MPISSKRRRRSEVGPSTRSAEAARMPNWREFWRPRPIWPATTGRSTLPIIPRFLAAFHNHRPDWRSVGVSETHSLSYSERIEREDCGPPRRRRTPALHAMRLGIQAGPWIYCLCWTRQPELGSVIAACRRCNRFVGDDVLACVEDVMPPTPSPGAIHVRLLVAHDHRVGLESAQAGGTGFSCSFGRRY